MLADFWQVLETLPRKVVKPILRRSRVTHKIIIMNFYEGSKSRVDLIVDFSQKFFIKVEIHWEYVYSPRQRTKKS